LGISSLHKCIVFFCNRRRKVILSIINQPLLLPWAFWLASFPAAMFSSTSSVAYVCESSMEGSNLGSAGSPQRSQLHVSLRGSLMSFVMSSSVEPRPCVGPNLAWDTSPATPSPSMPVLLWRLPPNHLCAARIDQGQETHTLAYYPELHSLFYSVTPKIPQRLGPHDRGAIQFPTPPGLRPWTADTGTGRRTRRTATPSLTPSAAAAQRPTRFLAAWRRSGAPFSCQRSRSRTEETRRTGA
jgi:hypothetical protein